MSGLTFIHSISFFFLVNKIFSLALVALAFASCQNSTEGDTTGLDASDSVSMAVSQVPSSDSNSLLDAMATPPAASTTTNAPAAGGAGALNPEHGKPGHRCDIAVGAPLNSPPGNTPTMAAPLNGAAPGMTQTPIQAAPAPTVQAGGSGQRINPPHGQPGHDCAVPVGQPLKG